MFFGNGFCLGLRGFGGGWLSAHVAGVAGHFLGGVGNTGENEEEEEEEE